MKNERIILAITCIILAIFLICLLIIPNIIKHYKLKDLYYEYETYKVENNEDQYLEKESYQIITDYDDYKEYLSSYNIELTKDDLEKIKDKDYKNFNYIIVFIPTNSCGEDIDLKDTKVEKEEFEVKLTFNAKETCGLCAMDYIIYEIVVPKYVSKAYYVDIKWDIETANCDPAIAYKPILYLYPETKTNIKVNFAKEENLTTTYPKFNKEWQVTAYPNGELYDSSNNNYYALYWEEKDYSKVDLSEGFYVSSSNAIEFLEEKLTILGLNSKERNEFIIYWLPILEKNEHNLVYFELTEQLQKENELIITPQPDTLIRIRMHIKQVDKKTNIKEQQLTKQARVGYTAVEWGGVIHN